jgi:hypothetical protein
MHGVRWRAALAGTAVLVGVIPAVAYGYAAPFRCRDVVNTGPWQKIPVRQFEPIVGVDSRDAVTSYSLAPSRPQNVVVTNGKRLQVSDVSGCAWSDGLVLGVQPTAEIPLTGNSSTIVSTAVMTNGRVLAAVREGTGPASRPHILGSDDGHDGYQMHDSGLPPQGAPRYLEAAADGRTVYLVLTPSSGEDDTVGGTTLPGVPDTTNPATGGKAGLLYASTDAGRTWELRTEATEVPTGGGGLDRLSVDPQNANRLYAISSGILLFSLNGGASFLRVQVDDEDVTAVETGLEGQVFAFTASGLALTSTDGRTFMKQVSRSGITSAAYRQARAARPGHGAGVRLPGHHRHQGQLRR